MTILKAALFCADEDRQAKPDMAFRKQQINRAETLARQPSRLPYFIRRFIAVISWKRNFSTNVLSQR